MSELGDELRIPLDQIKRTRMIVGERCRVESLTENGSRTLTVTNEAGIICVFKGEMEFTWVLPPDAA